MGPRVVFAIPGDLATLTGGYAYDRALLARVPGLQHLPLPQGFPFPSAVELQASAEALARLSPDDVVLIDGLAFGALPVDVVQRISAKIVALVHHPLALETGLAAEVAQHLHRTECAALAFARALIVTSPATKDILIRDYAMPAERITVALPGTDRAPRALGRGGAPHLLSVGSVVPRKGYDVLLEALEICADLDWSLTVAGSLERAPAYAQQIVARAQDRIRFMGEMTDSDLHALYDRSDLFVMSSHFEGYGMVLGEAMVRGLPIVMTRGGAMSDTVPDAAALKVAAGDVSALGAALRQAISGQPLRQRLSDASYAAGQALPTWDDTAKRIARVLQEVA